MNISNKIIDLLKKEKLDILESIEILRDIESAFIEHLKENFKKTNKKCGLSINGRCTGNFSPLKCDGLDVPEECEEMLNSEPSEKMNIKQLLEKAQEFNGMIQTPEDLLNHLQRVQTCASCGLNYYDKICPECQKKIDNSELRIYKIIRGRGHFTIINDGSINDELSRMLLKNSQNHGKVKT